VVGFGLAAKDSLDFHEAVQEIYLPKMRSKYPAVPEPIGKAGGGCIVDGECDAKITDAQTYSGGACVVGEGIWPAKDMLSYFHYGSTTSKFTTPHCVYSRYPSILVMRIQSSVLDTAAPKRLLAPLLAALKSTGSAGVHGQLRRSERNLRDLYTRMGYFEISMLGEDQTETEFLGRLL